MMITGSPMSIVIYLAIMTVGIILTVNSYTFIGIFISTIVSYLLGGSAVLFVINEKRQKALLEMPK